MSSTFINLQTTKFSIADLTAAIKKRYRDEVHAEDIKGAHSDAVRDGQTLGQAVEDLVKLYVQTDGHEKNLILTEQELNERRTKANKYGIVKAIILAIRSEKGATISDLKTTVRLQATMRKLQINSDALGSHIVGTLCDEGLVVHNPPTRTTPENWKLFKAPRARSYRVDKLTDEQITKLCLDFDMFLVYDSGRRQYRDQRENNHDDYAV